MQSAVGPEPTVSRLILAVLALHRRRHQQLLVGVLDQHRPQDAALRARVLGADLVQTEVGVQHQDRRRPQPVAVDQPVLVQLVQLAQIVERHAVLLGAGARLHARVHSLGRGAQVH